MIKRLPEFAEYHFASLCAKAGVICNSADEDELGWDFFISWLPERVPGRPADKHAAAPEALVQVKSTRAAPLVVRMKLSNALRAAQADQPFFAVLVVGEGEDAQVYARHFWTDEIARTLKRVRLAERDGDTAFNRRFFSIQLGEDDRKENPLGWMREVIDDHRPSYRAAKQHIFGSVGHENGFGSLNLTLVCSTDEFFDFSLGLKPSLPVINGSFTPARFGIPAARPELEFPEGNLEVTPVGRPCRVRFQGGEPSESLSVDSILYISDVPGVPLARQRWRLDAGPLRLLGGGGTREVSITARFADRRPLTDLNFFLAIAFWSGFGPVALTVFLNDVRIPIGEVNFDPKGNLPEWARLRKWGAALEAVRVAAHADEPALSVFDLDNAEIMLDRFADFVRDSLFSMTYEPEGEPEPVRAAIYYVGCDVGDHCFLAVVERRVGADTMNDNMRAIYFEAPRILDAICRPGRWRDHEAGIESAYRAQVKRLGDPDTLFEFGELEAFISREAAIRRASGRDKRRITHDVRD